MKKLLTILLVLTISCSAFCETYFADEFEIDLNSYSFQRDIGFAFLLSGVLGLSLGFVGGSTFTTLNSLGIVESGLSDPLVVTSYIAVSVSAIVGIIGFLVWKDGIDKYLETLRLQAQYYNLVR